MGGGGGGNNCQLLMLSPNLLKFQSPFAVGGGGNQLPTFDAEFRNAKIPMSYFWGGGGVNFQVLMLSPDLLKSKNNFTRGFAENFFGQKVCRVKKAWATTSGLLIVHILHRF